MSWIDKAVAWVSPEAALRRVQARTVLAMLRGYEGARATRRTGGWQAAGTSANAELGPSLANLRNRARQQVRDNPYASSAIRKLTARTIGTGIMARWPNRQAQNLWRTWTREADWFGQLDFYGLQALAARTTFLSGEALGVRRLAPGGTPRSGVPLQIQLLEPDYLDVTRFGPAEGERTVVYGVEIDRAGRVTGYWLYDQHPGDTIPMRRTESRRVPAADVIHLFEVDRPGQLRGEPRLANSLIKLRDLDAYEEAELVRKKIEACFAAFVRTDEDSRTLADGAKVTTGDDGRRTETLSPGMIEYLRSGEEVSFGAPSASGGYKDYTATQLHAIAAGTGITYEQLTGDFSKVTYLSARGALLELRELIEQFRWITFVPRFCDRVAAWWVDAAFTAGALRTDRYVPEWTPPRWPWVDPLKDVQALKEEIRGALNSHSGALRELGHEPEDLLNELAEDRRRLKQLNIVTDTDPASEVPHSAPKPPDAVDEPPPDDGAGDDTED